MGREYTPISLVGRYVHTDRKDRSSPPRLVVAHWRSAGGGGEVCVCVNGKHQWLPAKDVKPLSAYDN